MGVKIAIIGCSPSSALAPFDDLAWTKWGVCQDDKHWHLLDTVFEIHGEHRWPDKKRERLAVIDVPIYMQKDYGYETAIIYPYEAVFSRFGRYLTSSVAYMLALAILHEVEEIGIWGVDMNEDEYGHQRPNFEYLIGFAKGSGIKVTLPDNCPLLKASEVYGN